MQKTPGIYVEIRGNSSQLREELKKDGLTVTSVIIDTKKGELIIKADYE